ncbi:MAG: TIM-barrel domain-containing protein [Sarcina sp.]
MEVHDLTGKLAFLPEYAFYLGHANCYSRDWINDETGQESQTPQPGFDRQETLMVDGKAVVDAHLNNDMPLGWFLPNDGYGCGYGREETIDGNVENLKEFVDYAKANGIQTGLWTQSQLKPTGNQEAYLERDIDKEVGYAGTNAVKTDVAWVGSGYSFGLNSVRQSAEGITNNSVDRARPFVISLDGWAGTQRYASLWSGDQFGGEWEYIRFHIPTYIGSGLSGNPNVGSDMDGIYMGRQPMIQTRDFQWKAFTPVQIDMDGWGSSAKNPYIFGEPYNSINRMYLKLKGEMMPYIYTIANEATNDGTPMIRAMMLEEGKEYTYGTSTEYQYMWGPNMLVAPIYQDTNLDNKGNDIRNNIYLPDEDQVWIDYFTGKQYRGGVIDNFDAPIWKLPLFIKNGAIIPMANENNSPEQIDKSNRIYEVYPSGETSFDVYEDDGLTTDFESGKSATTKITSVAPKEGKGKAVITAGVLDGDYENIITDRSTKFIVNVSEKPQDLSLKIGEGSVNLTEATSLEEFENGENMYFYDESPNLNKYATDGSEFANVEIKTTPKLYVKAAKTNVKENVVELTINDFANENGLDANVQNTKLAVPTNIDILEETITGETIDLAWDAVAGATGYEVEVNGVIYRDIKEAKYKSRELEAQKDQKYRVRSVNKDGYSAWSDEITATTGLHKYNNVPKDMEVIWDGGHWANQWVDYIVDGNDGTFFYTQAAADKTPLIIDMKEVQEIDKVEFLGMTSENGSTGALQRIEIQTSVDGENYETVYSNGADTGKEAWATDHKPKMAEFDKAVNARYIKVLTKESVRNRIVLKEVRPFKVDKSAEVNKVELDRLVREAEKLVENDYTLVSFAKVKQEIEKAKVVLEDVSSTQDIIDSAYTSLKEAMDALEEAKVVVNKVQNLKKNTVTNNSVSISWEAPKTTAGLREYVIYKDGKELQTVPSNVTEGVISELKANTLYGFKVSAKYSNGEESKPVSLNVRTEK